MRTAIIFFFLTGYVFAAPLYDVSSPLLGMPYEANTIKCEENESINAAPTSFDCITFVEHALALHMGGDIAKNIAAMRYHGKTSCTERNHFFIADWLAQNKLATDITDRLKLPVSLKNAVIDRSAWFKKTHSLDYPADIEALTIPYLPFDSLLNTSLAAENFPAESLFLVINKAENIDISHVGFLFNNDGRLTIRHASTGSMTVIDEGFTDYIKRISSNKSLLGVAIWKLNIESSPLADGDYHIDTLFEHQAQDNYTITPYKASKNRYTYGQHISIDSQNRTLRTYYTAPCGNDCFIDSLASFDVIDSRHIRIFLHSVEYSSYCGNPGKTIIDEEMGIYEVINNANGSISLQKAGGAK